MTKKEAIEWFKEITGGAGVDRYAALDVIRRGSVAEKLWDDPSFTLGVEYGVCIALVKAFNISNEDLNAIISGRI